MHGRLLCTEAQHVQVFNLSSLCILTHCLFKSSLKVHQIDAFNVRVCKLFFYCFLFFSWWTIPLDFPWENHHSIKWISAKMMLKWHLGTGSKNSLLWWAVRELLKQNTISHTATQWSQTQVCLWPTETLGLHFEVCCLVWLGSRFCLAKEGPSTPKTQFPQLNMEVGALLCGAVLLL